MDHEKQDGPGASDFPWHCTHLFERDADDHVGSTASSIHVC